MTAIQILKQLHCEEVRRRHPGLPDAAVTSSDYTDRTANGLTKCVVKYVTLLGGFATRVTTTGQMRATGKTEVSAGQMKWVYGTTRRGTPDILGVLNGKQLAVEVKIGKDRLSPAQIEVQQQISAGGGYYFIARDFESVYKWINETILK